MAKAIHTMIRVLEEARSIAFYNTAFALEVADRFAFEGFTLVYLRDPTSGFEIELTVNHDQRAPYVHGDGYGHVAFVVDDLDGPDMLDQIFLDLPIMKQHGQHVQVEVTSLRRYEDFASDVNERLG